jgi:glycosyltransferase involved in cell wall biosynthesis
VLEQLRDSFPEWESSQESKSETELSLEDEEHDLADLIVVPSRFAARTLIEYAVPAQKIRINRFGTDITKFLPRPAVNSIKPLVFLFVGALTARKGLPLLLEAWEKSCPEEAELWIVGKGNVPAKVRRNAHPGVRWLGAVSRERLPTIFQNAHVFVCPSFFEGLAQVQVEAAGCGLPIIATTASGGDDVVEDEKTGFVIDAGNLDSLVETMLRFIQRPELALQMREQATRKSRFLSWSAYGDRWQRILEESRGISAVTRLKDCAVKDAYA